MIQQMNGIHFTWWIMPVNANVAILDSRLWVRDIIGGSLGFIPSPCTQQDISSTPQVL
jgi:hypothetical protein